jgi:hypothetical protein
MYNTIDKYCPKCRVKHVKQIPIVGKKTKKWRKFRQEILDEQGKNHEGYYECPNGEWTENPDLDHDEKRSTHPERVFDKSNIIIKSPKTHRGEHLKGKA